MAGGFTVEKTLSEWPPLHRTSSLIFNEKQNYIKPDEDSDQQQYTYIIVFTSVGCVLKRFLNLNNKFTDFLANTIQVIGDFLNSNLCKCIGKVLQNRLFIANNLKPFLLKTRLYSAVLKNCKNALA